jgi:hypothetical protein
MNETNSTPTPKEDRMSELQTLVNLYLSAVAALIARCPAQARNRSSYETWAAGARLGRTTRRIRTKGGLTDLPKGALVLYAKDEWAEEAGRPAGWTVWGAKADETKVVVDVDCVEPVCPLCEGSGAVRHERGLFPFNCPDCGGSGRRVRPEVGDRVRAFGKFEAEVVEVFGRSCDGRVPVLCRRADTGADAAPFADEVEVLG